MAVSVSSSGSQLVVVATEHLLRSDTAAGCYELHIDANAMIAGDTIVIRLKELCIPGGTLRSALYATFTGAIAEPNIKVLGPAAFDLGVSATIQQTAGTARTFPWKLLRVA
jgi:hypothetical protein